ncbi:7 transmembrane receptor [Ancylostoma ceylanicum]|uniref:7 transmembrane receptor n=1 Tax=Ancylostoma ceylanicum TaxID=53326 RepID=A0A0D6M8T0_9BILA|nr:7 transmembrane receptor [Ancylostoma ceylanicum]
MIDIDTMANNSVIAAVLDLKVPDENGSLKSVLNLPLDVLKQYCHLDQVADFANLTLFIYNSNNTDAYPKLSDTSIPYTIKLLLSVLFLLVGCIGLVGNILTVLVIYKTASLHSHTNYFLASLAISDLCLIVVGVPFDLFHLWRQDRPPAIAGYCAFMSTSISLFTFASILTIVSLTAERYVAICYPFNHRALFDKRRVIYLIYLIWLLAFFPSLYIGLQFKRIVPDFCGYNRELDSQRGSCDYVTSQRIPLRYPFEPLSTKWPQRHGFTFQSGTPTVQTPPHNRVYCTFTQKTTLLIKVSKHNGWITPVHLSHSQSNILQPHVNKIPNSVHTAITSDAPKT